jgi:hypothetical protein
MRSFAVVIALLAAPQFASAQDCQTDVPADELRARNEPMNDGMLSLPRR